jgi:hypothetical protein
MDGNWDLEVKLIERGRDYCEERVKRRGALYGFFFFGLVVDGISKGGGYRFDTVPRAGSCVCCVFFIKKENKK